MIEIKDKHNNVIARSKNLRGINERCRKVQVASANVSQLGDWAYVEVIWADGSWAGVRFASAEIAKDYINTKRFQT
jgi:hypothetical protein